MTLAVIALVALLCMKSKKASARCMEILALLFTAGITVCFVGALLGHKETGMTMEPMFIPNASAFRQVIRIAFISPWAFIGFESVSHSVAEYRFRHSNMFKVLAISLAVTTALYIFVTLAMDGDTFFENQRERIHDADNTNILVIMVLSGLSLAVMLVNYLSMQRWEKQAAEERDQARTGALTDPMTGVKSKHAFLLSQKQYDTAIEEKTAGDFAIVACDVNGLKAINDTQGHKAGEEYIIKASRMICDIFQHSPVFRIGGDVFAVIVMTADHSAEVECLKIGAIDFISKPYPNVEIIRARVNRCIELSEKRNIIESTERDSLTNLFNLDYFLRYVRMYDQHYADMAMDAIVLDENHFRMPNERYGKQYGDSVLARIGRRVRQISREIGGVGCRRDADTFFTALTGRIMEHPGQCVRGPCG